MLSIIIIIIIAQVRHNLNEVREACLHNEFKKRAV